VDKLILLDAAGMKIGIDDPTAALFLDPTPEKMRDFTAKLFYKPPSIPDWVYPRISDRLRKRHVVEIIEAQQAEDFIEPVASSIHRPTMVLWGEADRMLPVEMGKTLAQLIPGAIFRELPKCGHLPQSECPREVTRAIVDMVKLGRF
jgi:pimeloyl-ACP methyl ester carboxylesterase